MIVRTEAAIDLDCRPFRALIDVTLPMVIFSKDKLGVMPDGNALVTIVIVTITIGAVLAGYIMHRPEQQRLPDTQAAAVG